jgi:hypothetical protein
MAAWLAPINELEPPWGNCPEISNVRSLAEWARI